MIKSFGLFVIHTSAQLLPYQKLTFWLNQLQKVVKVAKLLRAIYEL